MQAVNVEEQLVVFNVGHEIFGVDISKVQEIIRLQEVTHVPGGPLFVRGVINLRGRIIPVIDLHHRFGLPRTEATRSSRIVVVETGGHVVGLVVDAVSEVLTVPATCVDPPSPIVAGEGCDYMRGIAKLDGRLVILLQLDRVLTVEEKSALQAGAVNSLHGN